MLFFESPIMVLKSMYRSKSMTYPLSVLLLAYIGCYELKAQDCHGPNSWIRDTSSVRNVLDFPFNSDYRLVWKDEFDGIQLDSSEWYDFLPFGVRVHQYNSKGNRDLQYYSLAENLVPDSGVLRIRALRDSFQAMVMDARPQNCMEKDPGDCLLRDGLPNRRWFTHSSGLIWSKRKFSYGYIEARIQLPEITGVWPAFWLFGDCSNEIDILEFYNQRPGSRAERDFDLPASKANKNWYITTHRRLDCNDPGSAFCHDGVIKKANQLLGKEGYVNRFHIYGMEWTPLYISYYLDSIPVHTQWFVKGLQGRKSSNAATIVEQLRQREVGDIYISTRQLNRAMSVIFNLQVTDQDLKGGNWGSYPTEMQIDYIRVYQRQ